MVELKLYQMCIRDRAYTKWMLDAIKKYNLNIQFFKIKGHTGNEWNEVVDKVAKLGTEVI